MNKKYSLKKQSTSLQTSNLSIQKAHLGQTSANKDNKNMEIWIRNSEPAKLSATTSLKNRPSTPKLHITVIAHLQRQATTSTKENISRFQRFPIRDSLR